MTQMNERTGQSYDAVALRYVAEITPVDAKPFERDLLDDFLATRPVGEVLDLGCGPGDVTRYLRDRGASVTGIDLSPGMIEQAQQADPGGRYEVGDMAYPPAREPLAGITAFYSLIHISPEKIPEILVSWHAALALGGLVLIAAHIGDSMIHLDTFLDQPVDLDFHFFRPETLEDQLRRAGFEVISVTQREPYPDIEAQTSRVYALARRPVC